MTFVEATEFGSATGRLVTWPVTVAAGENGFKEVTVQVDAGLTEGALLRAEAAFGTGDTVGTGAHVVAVNSSPPLDLSITTSADPVQDGTLLTVTLTVSNPTAVDRSNVVLEAVVPAWMSVGSGEVSPAGACSGLWDCTAGEVLSWTLPSLGAGGQWIVRYSSVLSNLASDGDPLSA